MVGFNSRWDKVDETLRICKLKERSVEITQDKAQSEREYMKEVQEMVLECTDIIRVPEKAGKEWAEAIHEERSVQFSCSVMTNSLRPRPVNHMDRPLCPSPTPGVHPNPCPLSRWCHPTISSSIVPFSFCPQSFPASGFFQMSQFSSGGQSIGISASTSVLPMNTQDWSPLGWTGWISLQSQGLSKVFSNTKFENFNSLALSFLYSPTLTSIHDHWKNHSLD